MCYPEDCVNHFTCQLFFPIPSQKLTNPRNSLPEVSSSFEIIKTVPVSPRQPQSDCYHLWLQETPYWEVMLGHVTFSPVIISTWQPYVADLSTPISLKDSRVGRLSNLPWLQSKWVLDSLARWDKWLQSSLCYSGSVPNQCSPAPGCNTLDQRDPPIKNMQ